MILFTGGGGVYSCHACPSVRTPPHHMPPPCHARHPRHACHPWHARPLLKCGRYAPYWNDVLVTWLFLIHENVMSVIFFRTFTEHWLSFRQSFYRLWICKEKCQRSASSTVDPSLLVSSLFCSFLILSQSVSRNV